jgi:protein-disulfide isomerase
MLVGACAPDGGEAEAAASGNAQEPQVVDLASLGYNEGNEVTAHYGVVEFADFGCIHCYDFHQGSYSALHEEFISSGDVLWKYVPITIAGFPNGELAGLSGICGAMLGQFQTMRDKLFEMREEWLVTDRGAVAFVQYAREAGLDGDAFAQCIAGEEASATLANNNQTARAIGVTGTPTFIIRGIPVEGAPLLGDFQGALRQLSAEVRAAMASPPVPEPTPAPN